MELSHNNGKEDQHLPLKKGKWYWKIINDPYFSNVYKILEFRNLSESEKEEIIDEFDNRPKKREFSINLGSNTKIKQQIRERVVPKNFLER